MSSLPSKPDSSSPPPLQPLNVGNAVSAGLRLYQVHFKQYTQVALIATLWLLLPFGVLIPVAGFFVAVQKYYALLGLIVPAWVGLLVYCTAQYYAGAAAIARLAYGDLTNQPEPTQAARRYTQQRMWGFFLINLLLGFMVGGLLLAFYIVVVVLVVAVLAMTGGFNALSAPPSMDTLGLWIGVGLFIILLLLLFIVALSWFSSRFSICDLPYALEQTVSPTRSIGRSWALTQKNVWRVWLILFITGLVTMPLQIALQVIVGIGQGILAVVYPPDSPTFLLITNLGSLILGFLAGIVILPLWQAIKAVIYYDLRTRREGLGLQLRDRPNDAT